MARFSSHKTSLSEQTNSMHPGATATWVLGILCLVGTFITVGLLLFTDVGTTMTFRVCPANVGVAPITPIATNQQVSSLHPSKAAPQAQSEQPLSIKKALSAALAGIPNTALLQVKFARPFVMLLCGGCGCDLCDHISGTGMFAPVETALFQSILYQGALRNNNTATPTPLRVVDIGANIGYFTSISASNGAMVAAFEPQSSPRMLLETTMALNEFKEVKVYPYAIGKTHQTGTIVQNGVWGVASVSVQEPTNAAAGSNENTFQVVTLGEIIDWPEVDILKCDTEGYELEIFAGAWSFFEKTNVKNVIIEIKEFNSPAKRQLMAEIFAKGKFTTVYNYRELYGQATRDTNSFEFVDVTEFAKDAAKIITFGFEDFFFTKEAIAFPLKIEL